MRDPILVAEPDRVFADLLEAYLAHRGYGVVRVSDGRRALATARSRSLGALVVALDLPSVDGLEVAASLACEEGPPVVLTADAPLPPTWTEARLRRVGIAAAITRPCPLERIARALERVTGRPAPRPGPWSPGVETGEAG
jgi:CheY-like chemotaxis protein